MPMKVTVCFDRVRIIVPCGDGEITVSQLVEKAIVRYKKATGKTNDHWVSVHNLRTINDGGILDPDDQLCDVVDDREQLIADYEEQGGQNYQPHNGDGASQSSAGTASPDIFQGSEVTGHLHDNKNFSVYRQDDEHDVIVTPRDLEGVGPGLTVRRGSEPVLNIQDEKDNNNNQNELHDLSDPNDHEVAQEMDAKGDRNKNAFGRFSRDSWRQSLGNRPDMYKWLEAQERQHEKIQQMERRDPVGGAGNEQTSPVKNESPHSPESKTPPSILINLPNDGGPLGIHVVPDYSENGREMGLLVQGVEDGGRVAKDGRLRENDRIIEINGQTLVDVSFSRAQDIFRSAMKRDEIKLRIVKKQVPPLPKQPPPPVMPKPRGHLPLKPSPLTLPTHRMDESLSPTGPDGTSTPAQNSSSSSIEGPLKSPTTAFKPALPANPPSPTKKVPPAVPVRHPSTTLSTDKADDSAVSTTGQQKLVAPTNTKKIGKKIDIVLTKGPVGLGFSVTTRDNPAGGDSPIYIKNILPRGAAITDGRLRAGDRLLEVNGEDLSGKTQSEVVSMLRNLTMGATVKLVISRQETVDTRFQVPRALKENPTNVTKSNVLQPAEKSGDDGTLTNMKNKEIIRLDIPLNDSGSAGLGVSVKGKTLTTDQVTRDLGIFVKSVIHGGAASKDGRLAINDQLVEVNGEVLPGLSNSEAMDTLRKAMQVDGPTPGHIHLVIARKIGAPSPSPFQQGEISEQFTFGKGGDSNTLDDSEGKEIFIGAEYLRNGSQNSKGITQNSREANIAKIVKSDLDKNTEPEPPPRPHRHKHFDDVDSGKARNFLIDRLTGDSALRNESYNRATQESFNDSALSTGEDPGGGMRNVSYNLALGGTGNILSPAISPFKPTNQSSPTVNPGLSNTVLIEDDQLDRPRVRPHSTIGFLHRSPSHSNSSSSEDLNRQPVWLQDVDWGNRQSITSAELSPEPVGDFRREGFGRQSMSEKRKGHIDPSKSEFYQRVKSQREKGKGHAGSNLVRAGSAESIISRNSKGYNRLPPLPKHGKRIFDKPAPPPPPSNLKRFSSLENLAQTSPDTSKESLQVSNESPDIDDGQTDRPIRLGRGRGCNESFRAAVDRSYDPAPASELSTMETRDPDRSHGEENNTLTLETSGGFAVQGFVEEESSESGSLGQIGLHNNSLRSSASSENTGEDGGKKKAQKKAKEKKPSIFKGLMKFGKGKKASEETPRSDSSSKKLGADNSTKPDDEDEERIQEEMRQLQEKHEEAERLRLQQQQQFQLYPPPPHPHQPQEFYTAPPKPHLPPDMHSAPQLHPHPPGFYQKGPHAPYDRGRGLHERDLPIQHGPTHIPHWSGQTKLPDRPSDTSSGGWTSNTRLLEPLEKPSNMPRAEWIQHLRAEHQRRHRERQGLYPQEDREEQYEQEIQQEEERVGHPHPPLGSIPPGSTPEYYHQDYPPYPLPQDYTGHRYGKSAIPDNILHGQPARPHSTNPSYDRPQSRPSYPDTHHNYPHYGHIIHPRQHSNEYVPPRQHSIDHFHQRQNSDISEQFSQDYYARRPPSRGRTAVNQWGSQDQGDAYTGKYSRHSPFIHPEMPSGSGSRHSPFISHEAPPSGGNYGDQGFTYRDPVYPSMAGKRPVHTITQPGSAKV